MSAPSTWIQRFAAGLPAGSRILDLACGAGRHVELLTRAGHLVTAVDRDLSGLAEFAAAHPSVESLELDLEAGGTWPLAERRFDLVLVTNYLHRPLFPAICAAVAEGGTLLYETFAVGNERFGKPANPAFLLQRGELLAAFGGTLRIVAYEDGEVDSPRPAVVQRICAMRVRKDELPPRLPPS